MISRLECLVFAAAFQGAETQNSRLRPYGQNSDMLLRRMSIWVGIGWDRCTAKLSIFNATACGQALVRARTHRNIAVGALALTAG